MNKSDSIPDDNEVDNAVDKTIAECLSLNHPVSFFVLAGAGSGKTKSLVQAIEHLLANNRRSLMLRGQRIGVITYTNAACDEIKRRINFDPLVEVSTIHSFVWKLIDGFDFDIRAWLKSHLIGELRELQELQSRSKGNNPTSRARASRIVSKERRLARMDQTKRFTYNPNGNNSSRDALNHSEVIEIAASFFHDRRVMQEILVSGFPILLIDECQDTTAPLLRALIHIQSLHRSKFALGLFGDQMQRIFMSGQSELEKTLPNDWRKPTKVMNHRCPTRIVTLINRIRSSVDGQSQRPRSDAKTGLVRLFVVQSNTNDKLALENKVAATMAELTGDENWRTNNEKTKRLILEHHMAATRMGFSTMFEPLYKSQKLSTGVLEGSLPELTFFLEDIAPVVDHMFSGNEFGVASIVRRRSPLVSRVSLQQAGNEQIESLQRANYAVAKLCNLWINGNAPTFREVLIVVAQTGLFTIPTSLNDFSDPSYQPNLGRRSEDDLLSEDDNDNHFDSNEAWARFLDSKFDEIRHYGAYIKGRAGFATHQGVKGLEFPRVMVIMDDTEARGFIFSYEKLFGAKEPSRSDLDNKAAGKDTGIDRTRRLFYVTCSRSESSLALVAYTSNPLATKEHALSREWFSEEEILLL